jgi:hypothetical protein
MVTVIRHRQGILDEIALHHASMTLPVDLVNPPT